jgi:flagellar protein FlaG
MSDLNVVIPQSGYSGIEKENSAPERKVSGPQLNNVDNNVNKTTKSLGSNIMLEKQGTEKTSDEKAKQLTAKEITETVDEMNSFLQSMNRNLSFSVDEQLGESVIIVKDSESEEVIRQIPSEELVVLRKKMDDVVGILFDTKV